jgi:hypothetical protein
MTYVEYVSSGYVPSLPLAVRSALRSEGDAKFHTYHVNGRVYHVIHVWSPDLRVEGENGAAPVFRVAHAYTSVFGEFSAATQSTDVDELRLVPIAGGIHAGSFRDKMVHISRAAVALGISALLPAPRMALRRCAPLEMCVFTEAEYVPFLYSRDNVKSPRSRLTKLI